MNINPIWIVFALAIILFGPIILHELWTRRKKQIKDKASDPAK